MMLLACSLTILFIAVLLHRHHRIILLKFGKEFLELFVFHILMQIEIPLDFSDRPKRRPPSRFAAYVKKEEVPIEEGTLSKSDNQSKSMYYLIICN